MSLEDYAKALRAKQQRLAEKAYADDVTQEVLAYLRECYADERRSQEDVELVYVLDFVINMLDLFVSPAPEP